MCTVTRPGLASLASSTAVELLASVLQHPLGCASPYLISAPALTNPQRKRAAAAAPDERHAAPGPARLGLAARARPAPAALLPARVPRGARARRGVRALHGLRRRGARRVRGAAVRDAPARVQRAAVPRGALGARSAV